MQYGFRNKMSCTDAIGAMTYFIRDVIDKKLTRQACFIDLKNAFDTIDHKKLWRKMEKLGLRGNVNELIGNYLIDRWQNVSTNRVNTMKQKNSVKKTEQILWFDIYRVRHLFPRNCRLMFYNSFAKLIITYELLLFGTAYKTNMTKIEAVQRRILRAIFSRKNSIPWKVCLLITKF